MEGVVFDIQKFSLHDGPGIRTTVFLKGCPLRCRWCSNPESFEREVGLGYLEERCVACFSCVDACAFGALKAGDEGLLVDHAACTACGLCINECPEDALKLFGSTSSAEAILAEVGKDRAYYDHSGGGLTLSGGEVLSQAAFARELLQLAKGEGLHTCVETSGHGKQEDLEQLLPLVDLFLFDFKATGEDVHRSLTGVDGKRVLSNLEFLNDRGARIHLRCPLIPGLNDHEAHLQAIASLSRNMGAIERVELLPYHNFGEHKYRQLGMKAARTAWPKPDPEEILAWEEALLTFGCRKLMRHDA